MNLTEALHSASMRMIDNARAEEEAIAQTLPISRFCGVGCRWCMASDIRTGLAHGIDPYGNTTLCAYCGDELSPTKDTTHEQ